MFEVNSFMSYENLLFFVLVLITFLFLYILMQIYLKSHKLEDRLVQMNVETARGSAEEVSLFKKRKESVIDKKIEDYLKTVKTNKRLRFLAHIKENPHILRVGILMLGMLLGSYSLVDRLLKQDIVVTGGLALAVTLLIGRFTYSVLENRRKQKFMHSFPHALDIITRGLRAGLSIEKTFQTIAREIEGPVGEEVALICEKMELGVTYEEALNQSSIRVRLQDYSFFTSALIIQKTIGGSLAGFMENVSSIIRRREELRLKIHSLSAEAKTTGIIIGSLPFLTLGAITYFRPEHIEVFQTDPLGRQIIVVALGMIILAVFIVNRLTSIDLQ